MRLFAWAKKDRSTARRTAFATLQRRLTEQTEEMQRSIEKKLLSIVEQIRNFRGTAQEDHLLEMEQARLKRLLDRYDLAQTDTNELMREWRDWMRAVRQQTVTDGERMELVRSELRVRGVVGEEEELETEKCIGNRTSSDESQKTADVLPEWDLYLGEGLPTSAAYWEEKVEEARRAGQHDAVVNGLVKKMRQAHAQAKTWRKMVNNQ